MTIFKFFRFQVDQHYFMFTLMDTALCTLLPAILIIIVNSFSTYRYRQCMKIYSSGVLRVRFVRAPTTQQQQQQLNNDTIQFVSLLFLVSFGFFCLVGVSLKIQSNKEKQRNIHKKQEMSWINDAFFSLIY